LSAQSLSAARSQLQPGTAIIIIITTIIAITAIIITIMVTIIATTPTILDTTITDTITGTGITTKRNFEAASTGGLLFLAI
jgi:hypothetical protein